MSQGIGKRGKVEVNEQPEWIQTRATREEGGMGAKLDNEQPKRKGGATGWDGARVNRHQKEGKSMKNRKEKRRSSW